jgi:hypothetical protein
MLDAAGRTERGDRNDGLMAFVQHAEWRLGAQLHAVDGAPNVRFLCGTQRA